MYTKFIEENKDYVEKQVKLVIHKRYVTVH